MRRFQWPTVAVLLLSPTTLYGCEGELVPRDIRSEVSELGDLWPSGGLGDKFLRKPKTVGLVAPGAQADLILLKGNPLEDVKNLSQIAGVMRRGRWYPQEELQRGLDVMVAQYLADRPAAAGYHFLT